MNKVICFSKNRPLQLHAYLSSLYHYVKGIDQVFIIVDKMDHYGGFRELFSEVTFVVEELYNKTLNGAFDSALRDLVNTQIKPDDTVLFGTDDVIYTRLFDVSEIANLLSNHHVFGFSTRLWPGILGSSKAVEAKMGDKYFSWRWFSSPSHYGYPYDLSTSFYSGDVVLQTVNYSRDVFNCPNCLESRGVNLTFKGIFPSRQYMLSFLKPHSVIADLNVVVSTAYYNNRHQGDIYTSAEELLKKYKEGYRLYWEGYKDFEFEEPFIGMRNFKFINTNDKKEV